MSRPSFWSRLFGRRSPAPPEVPAPAPAPGPATAKAAPHTPHKQLRSERREQLFALVRENMMRAGVLSGAYKFKVLTLDSSGQSFIVMIDIQSGSMNHDAATLARLESSLQSLSQDRLGIGVKNVYWRVLENVGASPETAAPPIAATPSPAATATARQAPAPARHPMDTITAEELLASRSSPPASAPADANGPRRWSGPDFAPTQPMDPSGGSDFGPLSETQPGRLE
jgi:hypothetical protein